MRKVRRIFAWICRPQALVGFIALCLCFGGAGNVWRSDGAIRPSIPQVTASKSLAPVRAATPSVDCSVKPCIALTFDDGPSAEVTPHVLDILARQQIKATFFIIGVHVPGNEALLQREHREGHEIGNHSWNHPDLSKLSPEDAETQIEATQRVIAAAGVPMPKIVRPPYGAVNDMVAARSKLSIVRWNTDPQDWQLKDPAKINEQLLAHIQPGAIILMHDIYPSTVAALDPVIGVLKQYYQFVTASELLQLTPGDKGQFFARHR